MKITPLDIQQQQFKTRLRGFDIREVDTFLDQMAEVFESLLAEKESLYEKNQDFIWKSRAIRNARTPLNVQFWILRKS